ncbi:pyroglutamyl peptidase [Stackebrandtia soli]|uniref:pyroglutamyl peptidase n=1 Tax=Stackebrandtia soli TaxID=1892856 RepID=UPI0039EB8B9E
MSDGQGAELTRLRSKRGGRLAKRFIDAGALDDMTASFPAALAAIRKRPEAELAIDAFGRRLWQRCVEMASIDHPRRELVGWDDRPLYWARLAMLAQLRDWRPKFGADDETRARWERRFEWASRGITSVGFGSEPQTARTILVSGFDPFRLEGEPRASNPSGSIALALDGQVIEAGSTTVRFASVILPVRYADFDAGITEKVFGPYIEDGPHRVDAVVTTSQGRPGQFDVEGFFGRRRSPDGTRDNDGVLIDSAPESAEAGAGMAAGPEFLATTLPVERMLAATGASAVLPNRSVVEVVDGAKSPTVSPDGPTPGSRAVRGSGGGFLSNEIAYRVALLRDASDRPPRTGHLHVPRPAPQLDDGELTDPDFDDERAGVVAQARELVIAAALGG